MKSVYRVHAILVLFLSITIGGAAQEITSYPPADTSQILIPATTAMETAWDIPRNPLADRSLDSSYTANQIRKGFRIFMNTPREAPRISGNALSCNNCHLNAGQREKAMPLVGIATVYPEYNKREGRLYSLEDRIVGCFLRSQNATGISTHKAQSTTLTASPEVLAVASYLAWLSRGYQVGEELPWRGHNVIPQEKLLPLERLDAKLGEKLFMEQCITCHGKDGQGVEIGDKKAGPLWGKNSWNDGAGAARIYTLAGMIRHFMPYLNPGSLSDEEAQHIAAFINSKRRPAYPFKAQDYRTEQLPPDAVYYRRPASKR